MKALVHARYGPPEVVSLQEIPKPEAGRGELLIRVHASTVNRTDSGFRSAEYFISRFFSGLFRPKYPVLGCDFAGEVVECGPGVTKFRRGDRVFGFNDKSFGGHAEYLKIRETAALALIPDGVDYRTAAATPEGAHYALCNLRAAGVGKGTRILINGATGAIGSAAVQLSRHLGAEITAVCATPHLETIRSLGAGTVIDYLREDFTAYPFSHPFDVVFDAVGKSTFGKCTPLLRKKGIYMSTELGPGAQNPFLALITPLLGGKRLLFPIPTIAKEDVELFAELLKNGQFRPLIDREFDMEAIHEAYRYVEAGQKVGNVVLKVME